MHEIRQGDVLRIGGLSYPVIVVSNNFFNESGRVIVCPILKNAIPGPVHLKLTGNSTEGYVLCEQVKYLDLHTKRFSKITGSNQYDVMNVSDTVMGIFDYQSF